jgi:hypothetical protein
MTRATVNGVATTGRRAAMDKGILGKKGFLKATVGFAALGVPGTALGQNRRLFGLEIPDAPADLLTEKPLEYARFAEWSSRSKKKPS